MNPEIYLKALYEALDSDNLCLLILLIAVNPEILSEIADLCKDHPFIIACMKGSLQVAKEMMRRQPEIAKVINQAGRNALHFAAAHGHIDVVRELVRVHQELCLFGDDQQMIPLHLAVIYGHAEVVRELVFACPESIQWRNSNGETALDIAYNSGMFALIGAFHDWSEEVERLNNNTGSTVVDMAAPQDSKEASLLYSLSEEVERLNNNTDSTVVDMAAPQDSKEVINKMMSGRKWDLDTRNVLLVVLVLFAGLAFNAICNPADVFPRDEHLPTSTPLFNLKDTIFGPDWPPLAFYFALFNALTYTLSVVTIVVLLWSLPFSVVLVLVAIATSLAFNIAVYSNIPKFYISTGSVTIPSFWFVWLFVMTIVSLGMLAWFVAKFLCCIFTIIWHKANVNHPKQDNSSFMNLKNYLKGVV